MINSVKNAVRLKYRPWLPLEPCAEIANVLSGKCAVVERALCGRRHGLLIKGF